LGPDGLGGREGLRSGLRIEHGLGEPESVAQVAEQQSAVIAHAVHPAEKSHLAIRILAPERAARIGPLRKHLVFRHPPSPRGARSRSPPRGFPASRRTWS